MCSVHEQCTVMSPVAIDDDLLDDFTSFVLDALLAED
jgi:hypothetical protein